MKKKEKINGTSNTPVIASRKSLRLSSQKSLRPSTRLSCAKGETPAPNTSLELPRRRRTKYTTETDDGYKPKYAPGTYQLDGRMDGAARAKRFQYYLKRRIRRSKGLFANGPDKEQRTGILSSGQTFTWQEESSGTTWVALHGTTPYCVVAIDSWPERDLCVYAAGSHPPVNVVLQTALDQISDTSSALREMVSRNSQTGPPFAVVSVAPGTVDDDQETRCKAYTRAVNFLISKLKDRADLTMEEIVKIGIWALKYLFGSKFQSNQLEAYYYDGVSWDGRLGKLSASSVEEYLDGFNETAGDDQHLVAVINETITTDSMTVNVINHQ